MNIGDILASFLASVNTNKICLTDRDPLFVKSDLTNNATNKKCGHFCILFVYWGNKINFHYKYESRTVSVTVKKMVRRWMPSFAKRIGVTKSQPKYRTLDLNW